MGKRGTLFFTSAAPRLATGRRAGLRQPPRLDRGHQGLQTADQRPGPPAWRRGVKAAGAGCLKATSAGFGMSFKDKLPAGVLSFWAYDDYFDIVDTWKWHNIDFYLAKTVDGKPQTFVCELHRFRDGWNAKLKDPSQDYQFFTLPDAPNHGGWTRFDIVGPSGDGPKQFTLYIDGYKVFTTPGKYDAIASVGTAFMPYVDELSFNPDPASFRPKPRARHPAGPTPMGNCSCNPGEKLRVPIALDPKRRKGKKRRAGA